MCSRDFHRMRGRVREYFFMGAWDGMSIIILIFTVKCGVWGQS